MRRIAVLALVAFAAALIPAGAALAIPATAIQKFSASVSPSKAGTKDKPAAVTLKVRPYFDESGITPDAGFATKLAHVYFPKGAVFNGKSFPSCTVAKVTANTCPSNTKIGSGTAAGTALGIYEALTVTIYNGAKGKSVLLHVVGLQGSNNKHGGTNPLAIDYVLNGKLSTASGLYSYKLDVPIPEGLQQPAPGAFATLTDFNTTIPKKTITKNGKKIPYIGFVKCTSPLTFGYVGEYTDGTKSPEVKVTQKCTNTK